MSWLYLSNPCASSCCPLHTAMRVPLAPGLPCALCTEGATNLQSSGENRAVRTRPHVFHANGLRVPDAVQRASGAPQSRDPQRHHLARWAPAQQRTVSRCAASGARDWVGERERMIRRHSRAVREIVRPGMTPERPPPR